MRAERLRQAAAGVMAAVLLAAAAVASAAPAPSAPKARVAVVLDWGGCPPKHTVNVCEGIRRAARRTGVRARVVAPTVRESLEDFLALTAQQGYEANQPNANVAGFPTPAVLKPSEAKSCAAVRCPIISEALEGGAPATPGTRVDTGFAGAPPSSASLMIGRLPKSPRRLRPGPGRMRSTPPAPPRRTRQRR